MGPIVKALVEEVVSELVGALIPSSKRSVTIKMTMPNGGSMHLLGADEVRASLYSMGEIVRAGGEAALLETAADIQKGAIARAPVDDGDLESAIKLTTSGVGTPEVEAVIYVDTGAAPHAYRLHENVLNPSAQPWKLGPKSEAKNGGKAPHAGEGVGWKYLERSLDDNWRKAVERAQTILTKVVAQFNIKH